MKKRIITYIVFAQIIIILAIIYSILLKKSPQVLGILNTQSIQDPHLSITPSGDLKYFFEPKANITYTEPDSKAVISINRDSLNETMDYEIEKPPDTYRIITIGDSLTFGYHVSTKINWTELLEQSLNNLSCQRIKKFEVINLGVSAYDAACSVERFKKRGIKYNPDLVIWYQVDLLRSNEDIRKDMDEITGSSFGYQSIVDGIDVWNTARSNAIKKLGSDKILQNTKESIGELKKYHKEKVVMVNHPMMDSQHINFLKSISEENNYLFAENFRNYFNLNGYFTNNSHPNIKGNKIIAEDFLNYLVKEKIIPCN